MKITSPVFKNNEYLQVQSTCDGAGLNPSLTIKDVPEKAESLVLIVDDPDALGGTFTHWLVWNIDPKTENIEENSHPEGSTEGVNDFGDNGYSAPCPPQGTHRYVFHLFALDSNLDLAQTSQAPQIKRAMSGHVLAETHLICLYQRQIEISQ